MASHGAARLRKNEAKWRRVVAGHAGSGLTVRAYCVRRGVREPAFYFWRRELARREANRSLPQEVPARVPARPPAFVPVTVIPHFAPGGDGAIEIVLAGQRRVRLTGAVDQQMLADVLAVLESQGATRDRQEEGPAC